MRRLSATVILLFAAPLCAADPWLEFPGGEGVGKGQHVVLVSGDEEYRSEETLPQMAKILSTRHGFKCTVLFAIDPKDGSINPNVTDNIPGLEKLATADLAVIFLRWRTLPDAQMKHLVEYIESGKPMVGLRTATHAFKPGRKGEYAKYGSDGAKGYEGGFGKQVLGETWVNHHGAHAKEGCRGIVVTGERDNAILNGIDAGSIFATSDVYTVKLPLPGDSKPLVLGEVTETLKADSKAVAGKKNDPMMPIAWTKTYKTESGKTARVFTTTTGASQDFEFEGTRRLIVNGSLWALGLEEKIPAKTNVEIVGEFKPTVFKFNGAKKGVKPEDLK